MYKNYCNFQRGIFSNDDSTLQCGYAYIHAVKRLSFNTFGLLFVVLNLHLATRVHNEHMFPFAVEKHAVFEDEIPCIVTAFLLIFL